MRRPLHLDGSWPAALAAGIVLGLAVTLTSLGTHDAPAPGPAVPALALPEQGPALVQGAAPGAALLRPPFTPGRRPPARPTGSVPEAPQADLRLTGIIAGPGGSGVAMAIDQRTQQSVTLRAGMPYLDWTVETVSRDSVTLRRGGETRLLTLPLSKPASAGPVP
ncbi:MAG: hypothetical protein JHC88_22510 [Niveispirillum sp.]|nr:hypothetical protein [Niveispirillum sp.]